MLDDEEPSGSVLKTETKFAPARVKAPIVALR